MVEIEKKYLDFVNEAESKCAEIFKKLEEIALYNQKKVLDAFQKANLSLSDIASSSGYGFDDRAKKKLAEIYARAFGGESAIVSPLIASGTHALTIGLFGLLRPGDTMLSISGRPYDTLADVIFGDGVGSLNDFKVSYEEINLINDDFDAPNVEKYLKTNNPKIVYIQRSKGYSTRQSLSIEKIAKIVKIIKNINKNQLIFVDNCYGEFVEKLEPCEVGADVMVGSLIKNAGGGIAPTGGYIVGKADCIEQISSRFIAPGIGMEYGSYAGSYLPFFQGCFVAPHVVLSALKGEILFGKVLEKLKIKSFPNTNELPSDIVRTITFNEEDKLIDFCRLIQKFSPVDSMTVPFPWNMDGYADKVIMAGGSFVQGSTIELSADGPIRPPYVAYMQGGLTYEHLKLVAIEFSKLYLK